MLENLQKYRIILASQSPRRRELLAATGIPFSVRVLPDIDESYPDTLPTSQIAQHIACQKAQAYRPQMEDDELLITADTIVVLDNNVLGKPVDEHDARRMLHQLSGRTHQVITGVCLTAVHCQRAFSVETDVTFATLTEEEIDYYVTHFHPMDKAGSYGIQEWIGHIGVTRLSGSYFNVMGLPVQRIYTELKLF
ncbi:MAG: septum formation protein Maf [Prevotella sp.]|nr:septum formation protein Maf [Prevotella sp.]